MITGSVINKKSRERLMVYCMRILQKCGREWRRCSNVIFTETWLQHEDYVSLSESAPQSRIDYYVARSTGRGVAITVSTLR